MLHRLNRTEYRNAVRDLLALDIGDVSSLLPPDDSAYGFDTIADFLGVSQVLLERYLSAAGRISALAVGDVDVVPGSETYTARQDLSQDKHLDGMPFGTVGGIQASHVFPVDGEYVLQATLFRTNVDQTRGLEHEHQLEIAVDGERVFLQTIGGDAARKSRRRPTRRRLVAAACSRGPTRSMPALQVRVHVKAGPRVGDCGVPAAFRAAGLAQGAAVPQFVRHLRLDRRAAHRDAGRQGTVHGGVAGDTPSRARVFTCRPTAPAQEEPCARQILTTLVRRAYRQPRRPGDVNRVMEFYRAGRKDGDASRPAFSSRCSAFSRARSSCCASSAIPRRARRVPPTESATSSWPRACPSSCGAAFPTTSC